MSEGQICLWKEKAYEPYSSQRLPSSPHTLSLSVSASNSRSYLSLYVCLHVCRTGRAAELGSVVFFFSFLSSSPLFAYEDHSCRPCLVLTTLECCYEKRLKRSDRGELKFLLKIIASISQTDALAVFFRKYLYSSSWRTGFVLQLVSACCCILPEVRGPIIIWVACCQELRW